MLLSTTVPPLLPNFLLICLRTFSSSTFSLAPLATRSTRPATAPMKAMPIIRVCSSGIGACRLATAKASMM